MQHLAGLSQSLGGLRHEALLARSTIDLSMANSCSAAQMGIMKCFCRHVATRRARLNWVLFISRLTRMAISVCLGSVANWFVTALHELDLVSVSSSTSRARGTIGKSGLRQRAIRKPWIIFGEVWKMMRHANWMCIRCNKAVIALYICSIDSISLEFLINYMQVAVKPVSNLFSKLFGSSSKGWKLTCVCTLKKCVIALKQTGRIPDMHICISTSTHSIYVCLKFI